MSTIQIAGATYAGVPAIQVPKVGGGVAEFSDMSGPMSFLGANAELVDGSLYSSTFDLYNSDYHGWAPDTNAKTVIASVTQSKKFTATGTSVWDYYIVWECAFTPAYNGSETNAARPLFTKAILVQALTKRPSSWANLSSGIFDSTVCVSAYTSVFMRYYGKTSGTLTYTWSTSYGFYFSLTASTFVSATTEDVVVNLKTPTFNTRCSTTYFSTDNAGKIDEANSTGYIKGRLYRAKKSGFLNGIYHQTVDLING